MDNQIWASSKAIIDLTEVISKNIKKISSLNDELSDHLDTLGKTFQDEGYSVIRGYVTGAQKKMTDAVPDIKIVMEKLIEYARLVKKSEDATKGT